MMAILRPQITAKRKFPTRYGLAQKRVLRRALAHSSGSPVAFFSHWLMFRAGYLLGDPLDAVEKALGLLDCRKAVLEVLRCSS